MTESATKIDIAPSLLGLIAKRDLIRPQRAFRFEVDSRNKGTGLMFLVQTDGYYLELTIHPRSIVFKRNSDRLSMRVPSSATKPRRFIVQCGWNPTELSLSVDDLSDVSKSQVRSIPTIATYPPNSLRQWARQEAQFPMSTHESPNAAYEAAIAQLQQLNSKIAETNAINGFWDCYYEGKSSRL